MTEIREARLGGNCYILFKNDNKLTLSELTPKGFVPRLEKLYDIEPDSYGPTNIIKKKNLNTNNIVEILKYHTREGVVKEISLISGEKEFCQAHNGRAYLGNMARESVYKLREYCIEFGTIGKKVFNQFLKSCKL